MVAFGKVENVDRPLDFMYTILLRRCNNGPGGYRHDYEITCAVCTPDTKRKGVTYTRWGRRGCSAKDRLVYSGFAASSYHTHSGSGEATLVLPSSFELIDVL